MRRPGYSVNEAPDASDASETLGHFLSGRFMVSCVSICRYSNDYAVHRVAFAEPYAGALKHCLAAACCQLVQRRPNLNEASALTVNSDLFFVYMICYSRQ